MEVGRHTATICAAIDSSINAYLQGVSTNLDIEVPFRHGKSELVSKALPAYFLGRCHHMHPDVIMTGYGDSLIQGFSKECKAIIQSKRYREIFPEIEIKRGSDSAHEWAIDGSTGLVTATGLGGSLTGKGASLLVCDDVVKNRAEARSETFRRNQWEAFGDAMTRRAPTSIAILCATSWHVDDVRGRLRALEGHEDGFDTFKRLSFPARNPDGSYLFPERFPAKWYESHYALLGPVWSAALLDCNPIHAGGNRFRVDLIVEDDYNAFPSARYVRAWDLASSSEQRDKDDPDYTVGILGAVVRDSLGLPHLWVKDMVYGKWEAPERNTTIIKTTDKDDRYVPIAVEAFGAYKDAYIEIKRLLQGKRIVTASRMQGDKSAKLADLEPVFQSGRVHVPKGASWLPLFKKQFSEFPNGKHDDACDATGICYNEALKSGMGVIAFD